MICDKVRPHNLNNLKTRHDVNTTANESPMKQLNQSFQKRCLNLIPLNRLNSNISIIPLNKNEKQNTFQKEKA